MKNGISNNMKLKNDFVTNSSSTCYLIYLPDNFNIEEVLSFKERFNIFSPEYRNHINDIEEHHLNGEKFTHEIFIKEFNEQLIKCSVCYCDENIWFYLFRDYLENLENENFPLLIKEISLSRNDVDVIININSKNINKKIRKIIESHI